jgi:hypothetical protein
MSDVVAIAEGVLTEVVGDGVLLYDPHDNRAHALNGAAAAVAGARRSP